MRAYIHIYTHTYVHVCMKVDWCQTFNIWPNYCNVQYKSGKRERVGEQLCELWGNRPLIFHTNHWRMTVEVRNRNANAGGESLCHHTPCIDEWILAQRNLWAAVAAATIAIATATGTRTRTRTGIRIRIWMEIGAVCNRRECQLSSGSSCGNFLLRVQCHYCQYAFKTITIWFPLVSCHAGMHKPITICVCVYVCASK